jgi:hypothetical protein
MMITEMVNLYLFTMKELEKCVKKEINPFNGDIIFR